MTIRAATGSVVLALAVAAAGAALGQTAGQQVPYAGDDPRPAPPRPGPGPVDPTMEVPPVEFRQPLPPGWRLHWEGASAIAAPDGTTPCAAARFDRVGPHPVRVVMGDGHGLVRVNECAVTVVDRGPESLSLGAARVWVEPMRLDETLPETAFNDATMAYFAGPSVA